MDHRTDPVGCSSSTCEALGWGNAAYFGSDTVCGESNPDARGCLGFTTWDTAIDACQDVGARLCTLAELQNEEAKDTGCNANDKLVWSQSACSDFGVGVTAYSVVQGNGNGAVSCISVDDEVPTADVTVRCCADVAFSCSPEPTLTPSIQPTPVPTPSPSPQPTFQFLACSTSTCGSLGWHDNPLPGYGPDDYHFGTSEVCSKSDVGDVNLNAGSGAYGTQCSGRVVFTEARLRCEGVGARLCSLEELLADEAHNSGCSYNDQLTWSRSSTKMDGSETASCASDEYYVTYGSASNGGSDGNYTSGKCVSEFEPVAVARCCADAYGTFFF